MKRRQFIEKTIATAPFVLGGLPVWASAKHQFEDWADEDDRVLVVIQMFGGNDGLNTVIPADDDLYYAKYRKTLNLTKESTIRLANTNSYLNPALAQGPNGGFAGIFNDGNLAVIQGVGYPNPNLSHFRSTDIWLSGQMPLNDSQLLDSGWIGRGQTLKFGSAIPEHPASMNVGSSSSLMFNSGSEDLAISLENPNDFYTAGKEVKTEIETGKVETDYDFEKNYLIDLADKTNKYSTVVKEKFDAGKNTQPYIEANKLSQQLKLVARLISGGLKTKVYLVSLDGFDTHADQGTSSGKHYDLLKTISEAVGHFMEDLKAQKLQKNVVGLTISEFGRRPNQNESRGTDHGAASVVFMFGEAVHGKVFGKPLGFSDLNVNQDFKHQFDFRKIYEEIMLKWFNAGVADTKKVLEGSFGQVEDGLLFKKTVSILSTSKEKTKALAFPNPTKDGFFFIKFSLEAFVHVSASQIDSRGQVQSLMPEIPLPPGVHEMPLQIQGADGLYVIHLIKGTEKEILKVVKA